MYTIIGFISIFGGIVFLHELGHFIAARSVGVRVEKFYVGFNPWGLGKVIYRSKDTEYGIGFLPLGGYCKIAGMVDESLDETVTGADDEFNSKNTLQKLWILSGGVIMNFLLAFLLCLFLFTQYGLPDQTTLIEVVDNYPAANAGIKDGSLITKINDKPITFFSDIPEHLAGLESNQKITIEYKFNDELKTVSLIPKEENIEGVNLFKIGVRPLLLSENDVSKLKQHLVFKETTFLNALAASAITPVNIIIMQIDAFSQIIAGQLGVDQMAGPVKITQAAGQTAKLGLAYFLLIMIQINTVLGFMNILPIPGLDGGHALMTIIEGISGRKIPIDIKIKIQTVAVLLILGLAFFILMNDIRNL